MSGGKTTALPTRSAAAELDRARDALHALSPNVPRKEWVRAAMGAASAGLSRDDVKAWSELGDSYNAADFDSMWRSISLQGGIGPGTLFHMAQEAGWRPADSDRAGRRLLALQAAPAAPPAPAPTPAALVLLQRFSQSAADVWARCVPADDPHGYIVAKQGRPQGLRVVPDGDPLRVAGVPMAGALVVPVLSLADGALQSLQFIAPPELAAHWKAAGKASKLNLPGAPVSGGAFIVGNLTEAGTAYLVEGIGQAWACWQATGAAAVVCFGWGNVGKVAAALRQRDQAARLVLVPDAGKEADALKQAAAVRAEVATMPGGSPANFDANDYAQAQGFDALEVLLSGAQPPAAADAPEAAEGGQEAPQVHPLARFLDLDEAPKPPRWIVPGFIAHGLALIAGARGVGKTTALLPLALVVVGLHQPGDPLAPQHWRRVIYVTEDDEQARRVLAGIVPTLPGDAHALLRDRFRLVKAVRMQSHNIVKVAEVYEGLKRETEGVELLPLVVFDTRSAVVDVLDENDNAEASAAVAALKQEFGGLPLWVVCHLTKANMSRSDAQNLTARGAGAWEDDANQTLYLVKEGDAQDAPRYLVRGKSRFEATWAELIVAGRTATMQAVNEFGRPEELRLRWAELAPPQEGRAALRAEAAEQAEREAQTAMRTAILDAVEAAERVGVPLSRTGVREAVGGKTQAVGGCIALLEDERWLYAVPVPSELRTNFNRKEFLIRLQDFERRALIEGRGLPPERLEVPASWCNPVRSRRELTEAPQEEASEGEAGPIPSVPNPSVPRKEKRTGTNGRGLKDPPPRTREFRPWERTGNERERTGTDGGAE